MPESRKSPDRQAADQYREEAARLRALADASYLADVRRDLVTIAQDYEALAQQREDVSRRYGFAEDLAPGATPERVRTDSYPRRRAPR